jgi:uncharacterized protein
VTCASIIFASSLNAKNEFPGNGAAMYTNLLTHAIDKEFPDLALIVRRLKATDHHFAQLLAQHDALDAQITNDEMQVAPMGDLSLENLKKQRLYLKGQIYQLASAVKNV